MTNASLPYTPKLKQKADGLWPILKETGGDWVEDNAMRLSAALGLYTILSLAPLLVITTKVVSIVWIHSTAQANTQVNEQLTSLMGQDAAQAVAHSLNQKMPPGSGIVATVISVGILLFSATGVFAELQDSMNTIWGVKPKPNQGIWGLVRNRLLSLAMVFGIGFLLLVSMFISTFLTATAGYVFGSAGWIAKGGDVLVSLGIITLLFAAIFKFLPDVRLTWRHVWLGAAITAGLFTIGKFGLALYFREAAPTSPFGAAGAPVAVLLWVYYSSFILFFGAEFTKVWSLHHGHRIVPEACAVAVTEEDRAQRGIPSERRMQKALAGAPFNQRSRPGNLPVPSTGDSARSSASYYALAAGGMVLGLVAGGVGAHFLSRNGAVKAGPGHAARLKERLRAVEDRIRHLSRNTHVLQDAVAKERIDRLEKEIRRVRF